MSDFGKGFREPGYSYQFMSESFNSKYPRNLYKILDDMTRLSEPERSEVLWQTLTIELSPGLVPMPLADYVKLSDRLEERQKPLFFKFLMKGLYYNSGLDPRSLVEEAAALGRRIDERFRPYLYEGVGCLMVHRHPRKDETLSYRDAGALVPEGYRRWYYRGLSEPVYLEFMGEYLDRYAACMAWMGEEYRPLYLEGVGDVLGKIGISYAMERLPPEEPERVLLDGFLCSLPPGEREQILKGMREGIANYHTANNDIDVRRFAASLPPAFREAGGIVTDGHERREGTR